MRYRLGERLALLGAVLWSVALIVGAFTVPIYDSEVVTSSASGSGSTATLVDVNGRSCLTYVAIPLVVTMLVAALLWHRRPARLSLLVSAWVCTALFGLVTVVGMLTIGIFLLPVAAALVVVCTMHSAATAASATGPASVPSRR